MIFSRETKTLAFLLVVAGCAASTRPPAAEPGATVDPQPAPGPAASATPSSEPPPAPSGVVPEPDRAAPGPSAEQPPPGSKGAMLMRDHFAQTVAIRDAAIAGSLEKAVRPAEALASMEGVETLPKAWQVSVEQLRSSSQRIRTGSDPQELAAATADIGRACGHCHGAAGGPTIVVEAPPDAGASLATRMKRHKWGTDRLWEGLYGPSTAAWQAASTALQLDPFPPESLAKGGVHARSAAARFNETAKKLAQAKTSEQRGAAYAAILSTCAPCHEAMGLKR